MSILRTTLLTTVFFAVCFDAGASERKAYKIVDEKGNVTYSQTPPTQAKEVKKVDISPANSSRGGHTGGGDTIRYPASNSYTDQRNQSVQSSQKRREEAEQQRQANLRAECQRNRGADCDNPEALRLIEAQKIPGGRRYQR